MADGKTYDIQIAKEPNGLVFRSGWAKFASAYELEQGDMLVFRYSRNSLFEVKIFDPNGCEKEFSCFIVNNSSSVKGRLVKKRYCTCSSTNLLCFFLPADTLLLFLYINEQAFFKPPVSSKKGSFNQFYFCSKILKYIFYYLPCTCNLLP